MMIDLALLAAMVVLFACGIMMLLERSVTRMIFGLMLVTHAANLLVFLTSGKPGLAPIHQDGAAPTDYSDPLPQVFILTAIVISLATTAFMLALLYRSWKLARVDTISDDDEDVALRNADAEDVDEFINPEHAPDTDFDYDVGNDQIAAVNLGVGSEAARERVQEQTRERSEPRGRNEPPGRGHEAVPSDDSVQNHPSQSHPSVDATRPASAREDHHGEEGDR